MVEVEYTHKDRVYDINLFELGLNLIDGFIEHFIAIMVQLVLSYGTRT